MKKLFLLLLILPLGFVACGDDEDPDYSKDIIGSWDFNKLTKITIETNNKGMNAAIKEGLKDTDLSQAVPENMTVQYTFDEEGRYKGYENDLLREEGTYTLSGKNLTLKPDSQLTEKWTIDISGNKMQMTLNLSKELINQMVDQWIKEDPEMESAFEEMEKYGVSITKMEMTMEMVKK